MTERTINNATTVSLFDGGFVTELEALEDYHGVCLGIMASTEAGDAVISMHIQFDDEFRLAVQFTPDEALLFAREMVRLEILAREALAEGRALGDLQ